MAFTTVFFLFAVMPASVAGYYLIKLLGNRNEKWSDWLSNLFLVLVSLCFYGWARLEGIALLSIYVLGVWMAGKGICYLEKKAKYKRKVCFMTLSILAVTGILIWYKYYNFIAENLSHFFGISLAMSQWIVPLGISFITFTAISYLVDVFRGDAEAGSLLDVFLYLSFFPKVISGPIVQWKDFQRQTVHRRVDETEFLDGLNRIMIGFAKKVILADSFGAVLSKIDPYIGVGMDVPTAWLFAFFYMMQIYYDFSGYSDIAIGLAQLFGFHFKENFQFPYRSKSITEFWRRWHMVPVIYLYSAWGKQKRNETNIMESVLRIFADGNLARSGMELHFMGCDQWSLRIGRALHTGKTFLSENSCYR